MPMGFYPGFHFGMWYGTCDSASCRHGCSNSIPVSDMWGLVFVLFIPNNWSVAYFSICHFSSFGRWKRQKNAPPENDVYMHNYIMLKKLDHDMNSDVHVRVIVHLAHIIGTQSKRQNVMICKTLEINI